MLALLVMLEIPATMVLVDQVALAVQPGSQAMPAALVLLVMLVIQAIMVPVALVVLVVQPGLQAILVVLVLLVMLLVMAPPALAVPPAAQGVPAAEGAVTLLAMLACQAAPKLPLGVVVRAPFLVALVDQEVVHQDKAAAVAVGAVSPSA